MLLFKQKIKKFGIILKKTIKNLIILTKNRIKFVKFFTIIKNFSIFRIKIQQKLKNYGIILKKP